MESGAVHNWESLPEYIATQQYSRCLGRILRSLPWRARRKAVKPMTVAAALIAQGIVGLNADLPPSEHMPVGEREAFRDLALEALSATRDGLAALREVPGASKPDLLVAQELIERIEASVRAAEPPPSWL